uniref:Uncharacterized protein n=1 Tax=Anguilla anguilla TaxID=7936 RepID=A0A0E9VS99_ANGAN
MRKLITSITQVYIKKRNKLACLACSK